MTPKLRTRDVTKSLYINYLKRAEECLNAAKNSVSTREWNAATINAIHSCIAACDAVCVFFLGKRNAGESHNDAVSLFKKIKAGDIVAHLFHYRAPLKTLSFYITTPSIPLFKGGIKRWM